MGICCMRLVSPRFLGKAYNTDYNMGPYYYVHPCYHI